MEVLQLQRQFFEYKSSLFNEGFLDDQFTQLQQLQDESNPDFVVEVVSIFFQDTDRLLNQLTTEFQQQSIDFKRVDSHVHQLKGSSSSIGAQRVQKMCINFRRYCDEQSIQGCLQSIQQLKHEYSLVKNKLETLLKIEQKIIAAGGSIPTSGL